jgi:hypothetical protein
LSKKFLTLDATVRLRITAEEKAEAGMEQNYGCLCIQSSARFFLWWNPLEKELMQGVEVAVVTR